MLTEQRSGRARSQRSRDENKELFWRAKVEEWRKSGLSVRAFAKLHKLYESAFYAWRREVSMRDREAKIPSSGKDKVSAGKVRDSRGRLIPSRQRTGPRKEPTFVPLTPILDSPPPVAPVSTDKQADGTIELHLPGGCFLRIFRDSDLLLIGRLLSSLEATNAKSTTDR